MTHRKPGPKGVSPDGNAIRRHREDRGLTVAELAHEVGISRSHVYNLELGHNRARIVILRKIANALRVPLDDLLAEKSAA